ncbi:MAG: outer membrane beta-barrel protein [Bacteroidales bacterium]|nr:outer membrane beta-barrel protein [Bacteroidales bacterium]
MEPQIIQNQKSKIVQIPIRIRYDLFNWLYIKGGLTIDKQTNNIDGEYIDNQSGIGFSFVGGIDLKLTDKIRFNIEPEIGISSLIPFKGDDYQQHFLNKGINLSFGYRF